MKEEKILNNLIRFAEDEKGSLRRIRSMKRLSNGGGWLILFACLALAFQGEEIIPCWVLICAAALGGGMLGLGVWFDSTLTTWPVVRDYMDIDRLRRER